MIKITYKPSSLENPNPHRNISEIHTKKAIQTRLLKKEETLIPTYLLLKISLAEAKIDKMIQAVDAKTAVIPVKD